MCAVAAPADVLPRSNGDKVAASTGGWTGRRCACRSPLQSDVHEDQTALPGSLLL